MSDIVNKNENLELELDDNTILSNLFGINDRNLSLIEQINQVKIQYRGNKIKISGAKKSILINHLSIRIWKYYLKRQVDIMINLLVVQFIIKVHLLTQKRIY